MPVDQSLYEGEAPSGLPAGDLQVDRTTREQYRFLDYCQQHRIECTVFTRAGATFIGVVHAHDRECMLFGGRSQNAQQRLIRKEFVAVIVPSTPIELFIEYRGLGTAKARKRRGRLAKSEPRP